MAFYITAATYRRRSRDVRYERLALFDYCWDHIRRKIGGDAGKDAADECAKAFMASERDGRNARLRRIAAGYGWRAGILRLPRLREAA